MELTPNIKKFIVHWGEMGAKWGINRTVAQIHALLYISPEPLNAEDISTTLQIARSNVSSSLRELQNWGIVRVVHQFGDRRDHFESVKDVCEMFQIILRERKKREVDPTIAVLKECAAEMDKEKEGDSYSRQRIQDLASFLELTSLWYDRMAKLPINKVMGFVQIEQKVVDALKGGK